MDNSNNKQQYKNKTTTKIINTITKTISITLKMKITNDNYYFTSKK